MKYHSGVQIMLRKVPEFIKSNSNSKKILLFKIQKQIIVKLAGPSFSPANPVTFHHHLFSLHIRILKFSSVIKCKHY